MRGLSALPGVVVGVRVTVGVAEGELVGVAVAVDCCA